MAGSFKHCTDEDGSYRGTDLLENLGDCYEAVDQMWFMLDWFATKGKTLWGGDQISREVLLKWAQDEYYKCARGEQPWPETMKRRAT